MSSFVFHVRFVHAVKGCENKDITKFVLQLWAETFWVWPRAIRNRM